MRRSRAVPQAMTPFRLLAAWAGVWALLLQIMVTVGQAIPVTGADGLPRTLLICSVLQPRSIPGPGSQTPQGSGDGGTSCPVCQAFATGASSDLPVAVALPLPLVEARTCVDRLPEALAHGRMPGLPHPRGPPVVA